MTDLNSEHVFEYKPYSNDNYDLSIFDELLKRDISEDTKALITAQREIYIQNETIRETIYERTTQIVKGMDYSLRVYEDYQKANNDNALNLLEAVQNLKVEGENGHDYTSVLDRLESSSNAISTKLDIVGDNTQVVSDSVPLTNFTNSYVVGGIMLAFCIVSLYFVCKPVWLLMNSII